MSVNDARQYHTAQSHYLRKKITYSDNGTVVSVGWLPAGAIIEGGGVAVRTAFNGNSSNVVSVGFRAAADGTTTDDDDYATALALGTIGFIAFDEMATATAYTASGCEVTATVTSTASASAGVAYVVLRYSVPVDEAN